MYHLPSVLLCNLSNEYISCFYSCIFQLSMKITGLCLSLILRIRNLCFLTLTLMKTKTTRSMLGRRWYGSFFKTYSNHFICVFLYCFFIIYTRFLNFNSGGTSMSSLIRNSMNMVLYILVCPSSLQTMSMCLCYKLF